MSYLVELDGKCNYCHGNKVINFPYHLATGVYINTVKCPRCKGSGKEPRIALIPENGGPPD